MDHGKKPYVFASTTLRCSPLGASQAFMGHEKGQCFLGELAAAGGKQDFHAFPLVFFESGSTQHQNGHSAVREYMLGFATQ
jgi:hypothetical protein